MTKTVNPLLPFMVGVLAFVAAAWLFQDGLLNIVFYTIGILGVVAAIVLSMRARAAAKNDPEGGNGGGQ